MNVLLITFSFPPAGGVGVLRALSLAKYLPEEGIRVDVLTARNAPAVGKDLSLLRQVPAGVTVHRTWTLDLPFVLRKWVKNMVGGVKSQPAPVGAMPLPRAASTAIPGMKLPSGGGLLRRTLANLLLPDPQIGWLPFAVPAARRIIRRRSIDAVVITVPPFSSAAIVARLRRRFPALPIVLDFRDEWITTTLHLVSFNNNERARTVALRTEAEAVRAANTVVLVTEAARRELIARYPSEPPGKFICIHNGFDREPRPAAELSGTGRSDGSRVPSGVARPITLTYLGTVYGSTDPANLIKAVRSLPSHLRSGLRLRFIGHIEQPSYREALASLGDTVELRGFLPQAEALAAIESTDWLLLVTHDPINVAAKFYDYLAGGKPMVAAVHPDGDVRRLLEQTGAGLWADVRDPTAIRALLERVLSDPDAADSITPRPEVIARFHRRALTHRYAELLRSLADPSVGPGLQEQGPEERSGRSRLEESPESAAREPELVPANLRSPAESSR